MPLPILMIVASEDDGGMARVAFSLARHLPAFDVAVRVVVHRDAPFTAWLRKAGVAYDVVPELIETPTRRRADGRDGVRAVAANLRGLPRAARHIRSLARQHGSRVLYSHNTWGHYVAAAAAASLRRAAPGRSIASVWHIHNDHSRWLTKRLDRAAIRLGGVAAITAVSRSMGQPFAGLRVPLTVVTNGIEVDACQAAAREPLLRARLGLDASAIVVAYAGRLVEHKGIHVLLEAARLAVPGVPGLHVVILGGSPRHEPRDVVAQLRAQVDAWGLSGRIHLPGHVEEVERHVADADLAVVPSTCPDGCPLAAIEALCLGVPVVASAVGGLPEIVRDGVNGLLVSPGDARALADAIVSLARAPDRRRQMAAAARDAARDRFDAIEMTRQVAAVLHRAALPQP
jgi:glycosyltransferase involved in cell wall biosynthesis